MRMTNQADSTTPAQSITNSNVEVTHRRPLIKDIPFYPDPTYIPPPKPIRTPMPGSSESSESTDNNPEINIDYKENSPFQDRVISEMYQRPDRSFFQEPQELEGLVNTGNLVQKLSLKQDIIKILKIIHRKALKGTHLPVAIKEIQAGYLISLYIKDIYLYLAQNKLTSTKATIRKVETLTEWYILLDSLLFKIIITSEKDTALLDIPEICADKIITLYYSSLFAGHQGAIKTYLTINDKFFIPNLIHYLWSYIKGHHICQLACKDKPSMRQLQTRINPNYTPLSRLSMDLKVMPRSYKGHKYILCIIDGVTNYLIAISVHQAKSEEVGNALIENVVTKYGIPEHIIMDQDSAFMSSLMNYLFNKCDIKIKTVVPHNHQSLQAEHGIKSLSNILVKHLTNLGQMWPKYLQLPTFAYTFNTPNIGNYSPF